MSPSNPTSKASLSEKALNAYDPDYLKALKRRGVSFARTYHDERPPGLDEWWKELTTSRKSPVPDQAIIERIQETIDEALNELAITARILPKVIPVDAFTGGSTARSAPDMMWKSALYPELTPSLTAPKPDLTIGWESDVFERFSKAMASLDTFAYRVIGAQYIAWPFFTVEAKGEKGSGRVCRLQNLHNGAIMLSNLYALKQKCKREETFFDKVHVMGVEFFEGCVSLSCYWATRPGPGQVKYFGKTLETWCLLTSSGTHYREARSCIHNAIEWVRSEAQEWICSDLQAIEDMLISVPLADVMQPVYSTQSCDRNSTSTDISE